MKKIMIASVSGVLAALPAVGVFAASGTTVTDTVQVTINSSCLITTTNTSNSYSATMTNGQLMNTESEGTGFTGTSMTINCNDAGGWHVTAVGSGADASNKAAMNASGSGTDIATGTATSGATSNWAMKVTGDGATGFTTYKAIPSGATDVATQDTSASGATIHTAYQVWISATQQADTYTGQVTYTLAHPAS